MGDILEKVQEAHERITFMIKASEKVADEGSLGMFYQIKDVLKRMEEVSRRNEQIDKELLREFDMIKTISVRAFEGSKLDDLIWEINSYLNR